MPLALALDGFIAIIGPSPCSRVGNQSDLLEQDVGGCRDGGVHRKSE